MVSNERKAVVGLIVMNDCFANSDYIDLNNFKANLLMHPKLEIVF